MSRRKHSKVTKLPAELRDAINDAIIKRGATYDELTVLVSGWVRAGKLKPEDAPSRAGLARYGKFHLARMEQLSVAREAAKQIVASAGGDGMVLDEAATNLVLNEIMSIFMQRDPDKGLAPGDVARIAAGLGKLQQSSAVREKLKDEFAKRAEAAAKKAANVMKRAGVSKATRDEVENILMGGA